MGQHVLAIARAELEPPEVLDQFRVQALDAGLKRTLLANLDDVSLKVRLDLKVDLFNPRRMDAAVLQKALERHPGDLTAHAIKAGEDDGPGVSSMMKSTPVSVSRTRMLRPSRPMMRPFMSSEESWTTETGRLRRVTGRQALHDDREQAADPPVSLALGVIFDLTHALCRVLAGVVFDLLHQLLFRTGRGDAGDTLKCADQLLALAVHLRKPGGHLSFPPLQLLLTLNQFGTVFRTPTVGGRRRRRAAMSMLCRLVVSSRASAARASQLACVDGRGSHNSDGYQRCGSDDVHGRSSPSIRCHGSVKAHQFSEATERLGTPFEQSTDIKFHVHFWCFSGRSRPFVRVKPC